MIFDLFNFYFLNIDCTVPPYSFWRTQLLHTQRISDFLKKYFVLVLIFLIFKAFYSCLQGQLQ